MKVQQTNVQYTGLYKGVANYIQLSERIKKIGLNRFKV